MAVVQHRPGVAGGSAKIERAGGRGRSFCGNAMLQKDPDGAPIFVHRTIGKFTDPGYERLTRHANLDDVSPDEEDRGWRLLDGAGRVLGENVDFLRSDIRCLQPAALAEDAGTEAETVGGDGTRDAFTLGHGKPNGRLAAVARAARALAQTADAAWSNQQEL